MLELIEWLANHTDVNVRFYHNENGKHWSYDMQRFSKNRFGVYGVFNSFPKDLKEKHIIEMLNRSYKELVA